MRKQLILISCFVLSVATAVPVGAYSLDLGEPAPEQGGPHTCGGYVDLQCIHTGHWSSGSPATHPDVYCESFLDVPGNVGSPHNYHVGACTHGV